MFVFKYSIHSDVRT